MEKIDRKIIIELKSLVCEIMPTKSTTKDESFNNSEIIDDLRVGIKYILLDNEALQRENKILKKMLGDR